MDSRRRDVLRVAGFYLVGFWLVLQIADVVGPAIELPGWALRALLLTGLVLFPFVLALAWFYDLSRHGFVRSSDAKRTAPAAKDRKAYELYLRANQLSLQSGQWARARDMYRNALALDPDFAPGWAKLGRCCRLLAKYAPDAAAQQTELGNAEHAFQRALNIDPELSMAHSLYAQLEIDLGRAEEAMVRLLARSQVAGADADIYTGLVQACRFCGLLDASVAAHERARMLDPHVRTSIAHTYFMLGRYEDALGEYNNADIGYLEALALAMLGRKAEAVALLSSREKVQTGTVFGPFLGSLKAVLDDRTDDARTLIEEALLPRSMARDGEAVYYMARECAQIGDAERAMQLLERAVDAGFFCAPVFTTDPWLEPLRQHPTFSAIGIRVQTQHRQALAAFNQTGGQTVLGQRTTPHA